MDIKMAPLGALFVASLFVVSASVPAKQERPLAQTNFGTVRGVSKLHEDGRTYDVFFGVPFGSSREGDKRWTVAEFPDPWEGELECTDYRPYCKQLITPLYGLLGMNTNDSEDCLFLNVYIPESIKAKRDANIPVLVFIYGGIFLLGTSDMYPVQELALNTDTIVVTFNYRLTALGFLSTGNAKAPGNYGLWDAYLALKWVQENIESFGGDPNRVTLMGQSAGGASASHLALSPYTNGLFQRYLTVSGSASSWFATTDYLSKTVRNTALILGCNIFNQQAMIDCLKEKSSTALDLVGLISPFVTGKLPNWVPVVDGDFVPVHPRDGVYQGANSHLDMMVGYTRHDAFCFIYLNFLGYPVGDTLNIAQNKDLMMSFIRMLMTPYDDPDNLINIIIGQYPDLMSDDELTRSKAAVQFMTDFVFASPHHFEAEHHSRNGKGRTYLYEFAHRQSFLFLEDWVQASHVDDLHSYIGPLFLQAYREDLLGTQWNEDDKFVSRNIQSYLGNFAATGNPNEGPFSVPTEWPEYDEISKQYLVQQPDFYVQSETDEQLERFNFWTQFYDNVRPSTSPKIHKSVERLSMLLMPHLAELLENYQHLADHPEDFLAFLKGAVRNIIENY